MELRQLEYFVAVAEEHSFTRAAARVFVSQPGISAQIQRLEQDLGEPLFTRGGRVVHLTAAGQALLPHARTILAAAGDGRRAISDVSRLLTGSVRVGMITACSSAELFDLLQTFHTRHPGVAISLQEAASDWMIEALRDGSLDLALIGAIEDTPAGLATRVLVDEAAVALAPPDDPLATETTAPMIALRERALIALPRGTGLRARFDAACQTAGFLPRIALEASAPMTLVALARRGLGVAIVPESLAAITPDLQTIRLTDPEARGRLELAWPTGRMLSPAARALAALANPATDSAPARSRAETADS